MAFLVEAEQLYRYYGTVCAVNNVSFNVEKGQILGFLGENGAGKTTTMQMLCGILAPSRGHIRLHGIDLLTQPQAAKRHLGYLPEHPPLYKELTVVEFLHYCAQLHALPAAQQTKAVQLALEKCQLTEVAHRLIAVLSKGYQQRVGIAQAILHQPAVIILDEPTVGLDPVQSNEIRLLIKQLAADHVVILSTHILSEVQEICTHVQIIQQGQLVLHDTMANLVLTTHPVIELITRQAIDLSRVLNIAGVLNVEINRKNHYHIHYQANHNPIEAVTELVIKAGWGLEQITPLNGSIEAIFMALAKNKAHL